MSAFSQVARTVGRTLSTHSPQILTGMAVAGVISTVILAVKVTPEASYYLEMEARKNEFEKVPIKTKIKLVGKLYIPAASTGVVTIACIIMANSVSTRRTAAMMSLYTLTENGFREYQEKVVSSFGEAKEQKVRDDIAQDRVNADPVSSKEVILIGTSDVLFYDSLTARYFKQDIEKVRQAVNDLNQKVLTGMGYASQNDFYRLIGLPPAVYGEESGWSPEHLLEIDFSTTLADDEKTPCIVLNYRMTPIRGYDDPFRTESRRF